MFYMICAILCSVSCGIILRYGMNRIERVEGVFTVNYVVCTLIGGVLLLTEGGGQIFSVAFTGREWFVLLITGILCGFGYASTYVVQKICYEHNGVGLTATFQKLGVLEPTLFSILVFGEAMTLPRGAGLVLAVAGILIITLKGGEAREKNGSILWLLFILIFSGLTDILTKIHEELGNPAGKNFFLLLIFVVAMLFCIVLMKVKKAPMTADVVKYGLLIGIPNYFTAWFLVRALSQMDAVVLYPVYSVGSIILMMVLGMILFHEKLTKRQLLGVAVILAAIALLNV